MKGGEGERRGEEEKGVTEFVLCPKKKNEKSAHMTVHTYTRLTALCPGLPE